jgi:hypothetical protein
VGLAEKQQISIFGVTQPGSNPQSFNTWLILVIKNKSILVNFWEFVDELFYSVYTIEDEIK